MRNKCVAGLFTIAVVMMISGCGAGNFPEPVPPVDVNRTYEKVDPSPAAAADFYDLRLKLDTENDRLTEKVSIDIRNHTDSLVDTVYLRFNPLGYFDYLCEAKPEASDANKDSLSSCYKPYIYFYGSDPKRSAKKRYWHLLHWRRPLTGRCLCFSFKRQYLLDL